MSESDGFEKGAGIDVVREVDLVVGVPERDVLEAADGGKELVVRILGGWGGWTGG